MPQPLADITASDVAVWLDDLSRERLRSGNLAELVREQCVVGVTTNPSILQKALSEGDAYDDQLRDLALRGVDVGEAIRMLTSYDVRWACDVLRDVYDRTDGVDGRVSIEVDPRIAQDTERTLAEAKALWWLVDRAQPLRQDPGDAARTARHHAGARPGHQRQRHPHLLPGAMRRRHGRLPRRDGAGKANRHDLSRIGLVASFFISRVDTEVDQRLDEAGKPELRGQAGIANARLAYSRYEDVFSSERW
jgi:transaldolase